MIYLPENKNHIISQLPKLSPEEKEEVKRYFNAHANLENQVDWNKSNWGNLTFEYFIQNFINKQSKRAKKKAVKSSGINGLSEGEDYLLVHEREYTKENGDTGIIEGYVPLSYEASKHIASKSVGSDRITGEWCIAWQKSREYWDSHAEDNFFVIFVDYHDRGESANKLDWGKEAVQFAIKREFSVTKDEFTYLGFKKVWNRYDNKENSPFPVMITWDKLFDSKEDLNKFGEEVAQKIKKSKGICRKDKSLSLDMSFQSLEEDKDAFFSIILHRPIIYVCPRTTKEKNFIDNKDYSRKEPFSTMISPLHSKSLGEGIFLQTTHRYEPFDGLRYNLFLQDIFPQGNAYMHPEILGRIESFVSDPIKFLVYTEFTELSSKQTDICNYFFGGDISSKRYTIINYDSIQYYIVIEPKLVDSTSFKDKFISEIIPGIEKKMKLFYNTVKIVEDDTLSSQKTLKWETINIPH